MQRITKKFMQFLKLMLGKFIYDKAQMRQTIASK